MPSTDIDGSAIIMLGEAQVKKILDYMIWYKAEASDSWDRRDRELAKRILDSFPNLKNIATETLL